MSLLEIAKQKYASKAAVMAEKWQRGFSSPEAAARYDEGVGEFLGVGTVAGSGPSQAYRAAQANASLYAQKYSRKVQGGASKWAARYQAAFQK